VKFITLLSRVGCKRQQGRLPVRHLNDEVFPACDDEFNGVLKLLNVEVKSTDARSSPDYKLFQRHEVLLNCVDSTLTSVNRRLHVLHSSVIRQSSTKHRTFTVTATCSETSRPPRVDSQLTLSSLLKIRWFGIVRGHSRSLEIASFDRAHTSSY